MYITLYMYIISSSQYNPIMKIHIYIYVGAIVEIWSKYGLHSHIGDGHESKNIYIYNYIPINIPLQ